MAEITDLDVTDASNTARWPEGMAPSAVNNAARADEGMLARGLRDTIIPTKTTGGSADVQTLTPNQTVTAYAAGLSAFTFKAGFTNTGACTLNVSALGAKSIKLKTGANPYAGAITAGGYYSVVYDGTNFILQNPSVGAAAILALGSDIVNDGSGNATKQWAVLGHTAGFNFAAGDSGKLHLANTNNTQTWVLLAAATAGAKWSIGFQCNVDGVTFSSPSTDIIVNGSGSGVSSVVFNKGQGGFIACNGSGYYVWGLTNKSAAVQGGYKNLKIITADAGTAPVVTADAVTVENAGGLSMRLSSLSVTMDFTSTGAGKLDAGSIAAATWYYIWAIAKDDGTQSCLGSTSSTSPTLPSGYTYKARLGAVRTKPGSAVFIGTRQTGHRVQYTTPTFTAMASGTAGNVSTPTWVAVATGNFVPTTASAIRFFSTLGNIVSVAPNNTYGAYNSATNAPPYVNNTGAFNVSCGDFCLETTDIYWASSQASANLVCMGWDDNL